MLYMTRFPSFQRQSNRTLHIYTIFCLSNYSLVGICDSSTTYIQCFKDLFSVHHYTYLELRFRFCFFFFLCSTFNFLLWNLHAIHSSWTILPFNRSATGVVVFVYPDHHLLFVFSSHGNSRVAAGFSYPWEGISVTSSFLERRSAGSDGAGLTSAFLALCLQICTAALS